MSEIFGDPGGVIAGAVKQRLGTILPGRNK